MIRRGLFGGTFDPVHLGHLDVANAARHALELDEVVLLPASVPPHRATPHVSAPHRFAMAALAVQGQDGLRVSDIELETTAPSYTSDTLDRLAARGVKTNDLFFVAGADAFRDIGTWKHYPQLLDRCHFVVVSRPHCPAASLRNLFPALSGRWADAPGPVPARPTVFLVDAPTAPVSSTDVRRRIASRETLSGWVPDAVAAHIEKHRLYRTEEGFS